jgi:TetR/AcrR family fatty acid metabolism transcriptional regulator
MREAEADPRRGADGDRRRTILRAAVEVFARKGYHGCRIADVAREADVAYGLVYHYFRNKEELLESVFQDQFGRFTRRLEEVAARDGTAGEKIGNIVDFALDAFRENPQAVRVIILEIVRGKAFLDPGRRSAFVEAIRITSRVLAAGQARGEVRTGLDPFVAAWVLFGALEVALTALVLGHLDGADEARMLAAKRGVVEIFLRGAAPASAEVLPPVATSGGVHSLEVPWKSKKSSTKFRAHKRS